MAEAASKASDVPLVKRFLQLTGYREAHVHGFNTKTRTVVTTTGGKYVVSSDGKSVRIVLGPPYPKYQAPDQPEVEEDEE